MSDPRCQVQLSDPHRCTTRRSAPTWPAWTRCGCTPVPTPRGAVPLRRHGDDEAQVVSHVATTVATAGPFDFE
jgi:hypothetical protein